MSAEPGQVAWFDNTVEDADKLRDFYAAVVGWKPEPVAMGDYADYNMTDGTGKPVTGICHARGANAKIPPGWLLYFSVANFDASLAKAQELGATVLDGPRGKAPSRFAILRDPAGCVVAISETGAASG